jgi:hypothetical protein
MAYTRTTWSQNNPPYVNATNLNKLEQGVVDAHDHFDDTSSVHGLSSTTAVVGFVIWDGQGTTPDRPTGFTVIIWIAPTAPTITTNKAVNGDLWADNSGT